MLADYPDCPKMTSKYWFWWKLYWPSLPPLPLQRDEHNLLLQNVKITPLHISPLRRLSANTGGYFLVCCSTTEDCTRSKGFCSMQVVSIKHAGCGRSADGWVGQRSLIELIDIDVSCVPQLLLTFFLKLKWQMDEQNISCTCLFVWAPS